MSKPNILLVDDVAENLLVLEALLNKLDLNIIKATSGSAALRHLLEYEFALILLDIQMPSMNGLETAKLIRLRENSKNTPIIFLTAYQTEELDILHAYSVGAADFLSKPIIPEVLLYKVEVFINLFNHNQILAAHTQELEAVNQELAQQLHVIQGLNRRLEDTNEQLEAFVYSTTHDLRAPVRTIQGFGKILLEKHLGNISAEGRSYMERIINTTKSMAQLIDDLLNLAYASQSEMSRQEVDLSQIVQSIVDELITVNSEREVELRIEPHVTARADRDLVKIALDNLVRNAWKFTSQCPMPVIEFRMIQHQEKAVFLVRDNGVGFDMQEGEKLFKPFQRLHHQSEFEGTGIGLTIVRRIVERHGGSIWFEAAVNHGASFYFTLI